MNWLVLKKSAILPPPPPPQPAAKSPVPPSAERKPEPKILPVEIHKLPPEPPPFTPLPRAAALRLQSLIDPTGPYAGEL